MEITSKHKIVIHFDDDNAPEGTISYVANLVEDGYTSGIDPYWEIIEEEDEEDKE